MLRNYDYHSRLKPYIVSFVEQKRANGYSYEFEAYVYTKFDEYCITHNLSAEDLTKVALKEWMTVRDTESRGYCGQRISFVRQLLLYIDSLGIHTYIPRNFTDKEKNVPHIFTDEEITAFFHEVDTYIPSARTPTCACASVPLSFIRMADEYRIIFRLIYSCGLRNSEACTLTWDDVDLEHQTITLIHSKGDKDRLVYLHNDMTLLLKKYKSHMGIDTLKNCKWVFAGRELEHHLPKTSLDKKFNEFWSKTSYAATCDKKLFTIIIRLIKHSELFDRRIQNRLL